MASSYPEQVRTVDPFASYNSNVVNQLTGIVTRGSNALDYYNSLQVVPNDSTSILVEPGIIYKDDMLIEITSQFIVDFTDPNHYITPPVNPFVAPDVGRYYIVLEYLYVKSRPAPKAYIKILVPAQTATYRAGGLPSLFFLKSIDVTLSGGYGEFGSLYDNDPTYPDTRREYLKHHAGTEVVLPTFDQLRDQSRVAYDPVTDKFYFGYSDRWGLIEELTGGVFKADTSAFNIGDLVYVDSAGNLDTAFGTLASTTADGVVRTVGVDDGVVQVSGEVQEVPVDSAVTLAVGDIVYLSDSEAGTITNVKSSPIWQFVGKVTEIISPSIVNILFVRGESILEQQPATWG